MSFEKYAPLPWHVETAETNSACWPVIVDANGQEVLEVSRYIWTRPHLRNKNRSDRDAANFLANAIVSWANGENR